MRLEQINHTHFEELFAAERLAMPWLEWTRVMFDGIYGKRDGWVLKNRDGRICGQITFSDYRPDTDIMVHCSVIPEFHGRWLTKDIYKTVFNTIFDDYDLPRCTGFAVAGLTDLNFHERLGFKREGISRRGYRLGSTYFDLHIFGMLPEERRWK